MVTLIASGADDVPAWAKDPAHGHNEPTGILSRSGPLHLRLFTRARRPEDCAGEVIMLRGGHARTARGSHRTTYRRAQRRRRSAQRNGRPQPDHRHRDAPTGRPSAIWLQRWALLRHRRASPYDARRLEVHRSRSDIVRKPEPRCRQAYTRRRPCRVATSKTERRKPLAVASRSFLSGLHLRCRHRGRPRGCGSGCL